MVIKTFLLLGLAAEYRSRRWVWSTAADLPTTVRSLWHSPDTHGELSLQRMKR